MARGREEAVLRDSHVMSLGFLPLQQGWTRGTSIAERKTQVSTRSSRYGLCILIPDWLEAPAALLAGRGGQEPVWGGAGEGQKAGHSK